MPLISGTNNADTLTATTAEDTLFGYDGDDSLTSFDVALDFMTFMPLELHGGGGNDTLTGGDNFEYFFGEAGDDLIHGNGGWDTIDLGNGGNPSGNDTAYGGDGDDIFIVGDGVDFAYGGAGTDVIKIDLSGEAGGGSFTFDLWRNASITHAGGTLSFSSIEGLDVAGADHLSGLTLQGRPALGDRLTTTSNVATRLYGLGGNDTLYSWHSDDTIMGGNGNDAINGRDGHDKLFGGNDNDLIYGGNGNDLLVGGAGMDTLQGDAGRDVLHGGDLGGADGAADTFRFYSSHVATGAARDVIRDFEAGTDVIDLSGFSGTFTFIGATRFTGAGMEIQAGVLGGGNTLVRIDVDGDQVPDGEILLIGSHALTADDFLL